MVKQQLLTIKKPETNEAHQKVLYWFFSFPDINIGLTDLSEELEISKTTAKNIVLDLEKKGFLIKKVYGKAWIISCNKQHPFNLTQKIAFNLLMVSELYHYMIKSKILEILGNPKAVILFGSYRKGDDTEKSDIDIAVEVANSTDLKIIEPFKWNKFGYRKNVPVNLHIFSRNKIDINLFSNIANGIVLDGFLEVRP
ncbi:nucleotidyltransferase domain-containing protein [Candidatus Woesearchaeota archaeon]|nr:nucleotidyltransferase domain-containing protein [Candidatus Woesearchaeota archaeon]